MNRWKDLHALIPHPCRGRPFVCDGLPDSCDVIVLGENPATETHTDWWTFWDDENGFSLGKFEQTYEGARLANKKRRTSSTRLRLKRLRQAGLRCLETNLFTNERLKGAGQDAPKNPLLPLFFERLPRLKAIIAHGSVASKGLSELDTPPRIRTFHMKHFSRAGYESIDSVAREILELKSE